MAKEYTKQQLIERSIIKTYRKEIWSPFVQVIKEFKMINENDKIAVCISGGKDSMMLAKCMQEIKKHGQVNFELDFIIMDPGYNAINRAMIEKNAKTLGIDVKIFETDIFNTVANIDNKPCYLCARMRRGYLYRYAMELGCNKIALGHHFDDVIETTLMGMMYGAQIQTMMPKLHSSNYAGMELIRPLYYVKEAAILAWCRYNDLKFIQCACRFTENADKDENKGMSKRAEMKELIKQFRQVSPLIDMNIFRSVFDINLNTIIGYHKDGEYYNFLDDFDTCDVKIRGEDY